MRKDNERGAIVVEATLSLTAFVFTIFTILTLVNVYFIQAKMSVALNAASKEISQYSYLYYALDINEYDANLSEGTEDSKLTAEQTIDGVGTLMNSFSGAQNSIDTGDFDQLVASIESGVTSVDSLVTMYADKLADDPKGFILGMGKMAASELKEEVKVVLGQVLAKTFMQKNLMAYQGDDPDAFLKRYRVVDGMAGLDFDYTSLMAYGTSNQIQLCVTYDVSVIKLLNIDFTFTFRQVSKTNAWGNGISLINPEQNDPSGSTTGTIWDNPSSTERGKIIVLEEKKKYTYTSSGQGFDAYNNAGGKNEFVTIMSVDTTLSSYQSASGIKNVLNSNYTKMEDNVSKLDGTINVQNKSGATVPITSNKDTRTYKVVLVVPANSDMTVVNQAVNEFKSSHPGVTVDINTDYGSPTPKEDTEQNKQEGES